LRSRTFKPEDITESNVNEVVDFIFEDDIEKYLMEKSHLENKAKRLEEVEQEAEIFKAKAISSEALVKESMEEKRIALKQAEEAISLAKSYEKQVKTIEFEKRKTKLNKYKKKTKMYYCMCWVSVILITVLCILLFTFLLSLLKTSKDTPLSILFGIITTIALVIAFVRFSSIKKGVLKRTKDYYVSLLNSPIN
jgi:cation transport ATPase